jgi:uncharacterized protein YoxC
MNTASEILVIILSVFLALFLILGIVLTIYLIKITRQIKHITQTAEKTVDGIENVVSVANMIHKYIKKFTKGKK